MGSDPARIPDHQLQLWINARTFQLSRLLTEAEVDPSSVPAKRFGLTFLREHLGLPLEPGWLEKPLAFLRL